MNKSKSSEKATTMSIYICSWKIWDAAPPALDGFWNGDMEMTCGLRIVELFRLRLAGLLLLFLLHLSLLVEDLLGLAVADEEDDGGEYQDDRAPCAAVAETKGVSARTSWGGKVC